MTVTDEGRSRWLFRRASGWGDKNVERGGSGHLQCSHRSLDDKNVAWGWWGALWCGHRLRGDRNRRELWPGPHAGIGRHRLGAISMDVEAPSVRRGSRLSALQVELSCGAFVCGGGALASGGVRKMSGDGPAGHGGVVVIRWVTKMSHEACEGHCRAATSLVVTEISRGAGEDHRGAATGGGVTEIVASRGLVRRGCWAGC